MFTLKLCPFLFIQFLCLNFWPANTYASQAQKKFDESYFLFQVSYTDQHSSSYDITAKLSKQKHGEYLAELKDSRYPEKRFRHTDEKGLLSFATQLEHYEKIFGKEWNVGEFPKVCSGTVLLKIQVGGKIKQLKLCPNDANPSKNQLKVMNWIVFLKKWSNDQFAPSL